ncbi:serine hydrolase domain-containing protein [Paenibacillus sp. SAF-054]
MRKGHIPGLSMAFIEDGVLKRQDCYGETEAGSSRAVQRDTMFNACSISKLAAGILAMILVEERVLRLDEDISPLLVSWSIPEHPAYSRSVTLRRLLSHQAGFADPKGGFGEYSCEHGVPELPQLLAGTTYYAPEPAALTVEPGSEFIYSDTGFSILQLLIEDVAGEKFSELLRQRVFEPLHMNHSCIIMNESQIRPEFACGHDQHGIRLQEPYTIYPYPAAAGLWSTPTDLAVLMAELLASLRGEGKLGITADTASEMIRSQGDFRWAGLGIFLDSSNQGVEISSLGWGSGFQSLAVAYPGTGNGAVLMMNIDPGIHQSESLLGQISALWQQGQFA